MLGPRAASGRAGAVRFPHAELVLNTRSLDVHVLRASALESRHRLNAVLRRHDGEVLARFGPPCDTFWRSALKPFQALPTVEDGAAEAFGFGVEEIALACASHGGRPEHVLGVRRMLAALGIEEASLHCGPHSPYDHDTEVAIECGGGAPGRVHNNCSGKHAALIALARHHGWEVDGYWRLDHPVQRRIRERLADWIDTDPERLVWGTDGCGVPTPRLSLAEMALAYARFGRAAARDEPGPAAVVAAMTSRPELTSSPGREPLRIMQATDGRLLAKEGAEGVICLAAPADGWGLALKVEDGTRRAVGPGAIGVLAAAGLITDEERARLADLEVQPVMATTGERVGELRAVIDGAEDG